MGGGMGKCGDRYEKVCWGVQGGLERGVKSVLGCGEKYGKVCRSVGGGEKKCREVL